MSEELREYLRSSFEYEDGTLRRVRGGRVPYPWRPSGRRGAYLMHSCLGGRCVYLHQAVWLYHYDDLPAMLDHIDGDPRNNRIENLRACSSATNQYNSKRKSNNKSGFKGVVFHGRGCVSRPWHARLVVDGFQRSLGYYASPEKAHKAYCLALQEVAGDFARTE